MVNSGIFGLNRNAVLNDAAVVVAIPRQVFAQVFAADASSALDGRAMLGRDVGVAVEPRPDMGLLDGAADSAGQSRLATSGADCETEGCDTHSPLIHLKLLGYNCFYALRCLRPITTVVRLVV